MPPFGPIKRQALIGYLRRPGFTGPYSGGNHQFILKGVIRVRPPNPHQGDISKDLLNRLLRQAGIDRDEWERL
jgi:hypothetical protein